MPDTTVLVAVPQPQVREALVAMVGALDGFRVVGESGSHADTLRLARRLRPTLVVIDQDQPDGCGLWTVQALRDEHLVPAIVALGLRADDRTRTRARHAGAQAYVQTGASPGEVLAALDTALLAAAAGDAALASSSRMPLAPLFQPA